ncbi:MAG: hypothetical protein U5Q44_06520 [Dehalococcoidia bacterium]|nr:hypothetical protein [Dehalococcoidia bacterium]
MTEIGRDGLRRWMLAALALLAVGVALQPVGPAKGSHDSMGSFYPAQPGVDDRAGATNTTWSLDIVGDPCIDAILYFDSYTSGASLRRHEVGAFGYPTGVDQPAMARPAARETYCGT